MKIYFSKALVWVIFLITSTVSISANLDNLNFNYTSPPITQFKNKSVAISPGVSFEIGEYLTTTNFNKRKDLSPFFTSKFRKKHLKSAVNYKEEIKGLGDRLKVTRTLIVDFKNPCDPKIPKDQSFCFKLTKKKMSKEATKDIALIRSKLKNKLKATKRKNEQIKIRNILSMEDKELLGYVLNQSSTQKIITQTSFVPLVSIDPAAVGKIDLSNLKEPLAMRRWDIKAPIKLNTNINFKNTSGYILQTETQDSKSNGTGYEFDNTNSYKQNLIMGKLYGNPYNNRFEVTFAKKTSWHSRYYLGFYYSLGFKFGFQFPFILNVDTEITHVYQQKSRKMLAQYPAKYLCPEASDASEANLCAARGKVTISATPASLGKSDQLFYQDAGVPTSEVEDQEFVFKITASCYMTISVPGSRKNHKCPGSINEDLGDHFVPPLGTSREERLVALYLPENIARSIPLGLDIGIAYAILMPGVAVKGKDGLLSFDIARDSSKFDTDLSQISLGIDKRSISMYENLSRTPGADWGFKIRSPKYSFRASLVPSLKAQIGIDYVYEWHKAYEFDLDNIKINLGREQFSHLSSTPREHKFKVGTRKEN